MFSDLNNRTEWKLDERVEISGATNAPMEVSVVPDLSDHPLVIGPRYRSDEMKALYVSHLGNYTSGVFCKFMIYYYN